MNHIKLSDNDLGQILDGLEVLIEQWHATEQYFLTGEQQEGDYIRDARDASEAHSIAMTYQTIQERIREQLATHSRLSQNSRIDHESP